MTDPSAAVRIECAAALGRTDILAAEFGSTIPITVLQALRALELAGSADAALLDTVRATLERWQDRTDTPLALFIRFSCEAILGIDSKY